MTTTIAAATAQGRPTRWLGFGALILAVLLVSVDGTVLALAMPSIGRDLAATGTQMLWIGDVYSFVLAGLLVTMGTLGDRIGRRKLLLYGAAGFGLVSTAIAYAPSAPWLIAGRVLLGVAGATLMPATLALIRTLFPDSRERSTAIGIWGAAMSAGAALGPVLGGFLLEHFWWGSAFLINAPVMAILLAVGGKLLPESRNPEPGPWDLPSVALSMVGMLGVVYAVKEIAAHGPGTGTVAAAMLGVAALLAFARRQLSLPHPLIDVRLFRNRTFGGVIAAGMLSVLGLSGLLYFLSQYFQLVVGYRPLEAGLAELPAALGSMLFGILAGATTRRTSVRTVLGGGMALSGLAMATLTVVEASTPYLLLGTALFLMGAGMGLAFTVASDVILTVVPPHQAGAASAVSETAYELGMALGIATLGTVVTGAYRDAALPAGTPAHLAAAAHDSLAGAAAAAETLPAAQAAALLDAARTAFTDGLALATTAGSILLLAAAAAVVALVRTPRPEK
ncbi:MFS transporter [Couchioplanes azureus]|uniref:MFS transporter n=1 Tax=Couchioplanes caeruleus TaxID=56438 RepID=UPI0016703358|nr:MFS transporter [Couchioplanes caeruleus]GGQ74024.1 MFS transporter [Couchioplanes caeruleus subsp. azureus]